MSDVLTGITAHQDQIIYILKKATEKDWLEELGIIGNILSAIIVAIVGGIFTYFYQRGQAALECERMQIAELNAVSRLLPHLVSDNEQLKRFALQSLTSLGSARIATSFASPDHARG